MSKVFRILRIEKHIGNIDLGNICIDENLRRARILKVNLNHIHKMDIKRFEQAFLDFTEAVFRLFVLIMKRLFYQVLHTSLGLEAIQILAAFCRASPQVGFCFLLKNVQN